MTHTPSRLRKEFEKAFSEACFVQIQDGPFIGQKIGVFTSSTQVALWAAQWAFEKAAEACEEINSLDISPDEAADKLRLLGESLK